MTKQNTIQYTEPMITTKNDQIYPISTKICVSVWERKAWGLKIGLISFCWIVFLLGVPGVAFHQQYVTVKFFSEWILLDQNLNVDKIETTVSIKCFSEPFFQKSMYLRSVIRMKHKYYFSARTQLCYEMTRNHWCKSALGWIFPQRNFPFFIKLFHGNRSQRYQMH